MKPSPSSPSSPRNPWWIPSFFGPVPDVDRSLLSLLGFVAFALFFENYDFSLLNAALKHISHDLGIAETELGEFTALIRLGALPAFVLIPFSDVIGRRRLFLVSFIGLSLGTFLTAFTQSPAQFIAAQVATRTFMLTASAIAIVIVTEEFPAAHRGWGIGMLAALAAVGHGFGALLFAAVDLLPYGWRALYAFGFVPLLLLPRFRAGITETRRFSEQRRAAMASVVEVAGHWFAPLLGLARENPARAAGVMLVAALSSFGHAVVYAFIGYFVLTYRGWQPWQYSAMVVACGALGVIGNVYAGRLADRYGRRVVGLVVLGVFPLLSLLFFRGPGWSLPATWILLVLVTMAGNVIVRALSTELFPTSQRGTSAGMMSLAETFGAGVGLLVLSTLTAERGDLIEMLPLVSAATLVGAVLVLLLPETRQRELEAISTETRTLAADDSLR